MRLRHLSWSSDARRDFRRNLNTQYLQRVFFIAECQRLADLSAEHRLTKRRFERNLSRGGFSLIVPDQNEGLRLAVEAEAHPDPKLYLVARWYRSKLGSGLSRLPIPKVSLYICRIGFICRAQCALEVCDALLDQHEPPNRNQ